MTISQHRSGTWRRLAMGAAALSLVAVATPAMALTVAPVPEPSTLSLVALGAAAGLFLAWRNKRNSKR